MLEPEQLEVHICEPQCGDWEVNGCPLEEQSMHLTAESSLQTLNSRFLSDSGIRNLSQSISYSYYNLEILPELIIYA